MSDCDGCLERKCASHPLRIICSIYYTKQGVNTVYHQVEGGLVMSASLSGA